MPRSLRILFIATDLSSGGGVNRAIRDLAVLFRCRLGTKVSIVNARSSRPSTYAFPDDVPVEMHRRQPLLSYFRLLIRLRRSRPDVVIGSWTQDNILITLAFLFSCTRTVLVEHASWHFQPWAVRALRRFVYPFAAQVVVLNRRDLDHYARYLRNVRLIPDPVTAPESAPKEPREKLILAIGHLTPLKNFDDAIRAFAESGLEREGWSLAIIGSGSEEMRLRALIAQLGLKRAHIHPPEDDLEPWYSRASILLVTSRLESFSLVLAEAMVRGVVPIAYASDGPSFILENYPEQLVPMSDVGALSRRLLAVAQETDLLPLRARLRGSIEARFSAAVIAEQWRKLLEATACQSSSAC